MDLGVPAAAAARILRGGYDILILGHVHRQELRLIDVDGSEREVYTLGSWETEASILEFDGSRLGFRCVPLAED
jgi:UDP-2,3-diacylglucosamine pyrophosphatase LpxH